MDFQAHEQVIDPVQERTRILLEHLSKSFVLVDVVRSKKEWALEKMGELSASVSDLKNRFEAEAKQYGTKPEEVLMTSIRNKSQQLREQLETLKGKGQQVGSIVLDLWTRRKKDGEQLSPPFDSSHLVVINSCLLG